MNSSRSAWFRRGAVLVATLAGLTLAGCGGQAPAAQETDSGVGDDWDAVVAAAAEEEGPLTITTLANPQDQALLVEGFAEAYPDIDVEIVFRPAPELPTAIEAEVSSGVITTDIVQDSLAAWHVFTHDVDEETSLFETAWGPEIDAAKERDPDIFHYGDRTLSPSASLLGFAWNDAAVKNTPTSMLGIIHDPAAKGRIGTYDITTNPTTVALMTAFQETSGDDNFIADLGKTSPRFYVGGGPIVQAVASGEVDYGIPALWGPVSESPGVSFGVNEEMPVEIPAQLSILKGAPHPNTALLFINWAVSEEGQAKLNSLQTADGQFEGETFIMWSEMYDQDTIDANTAKFRELFGI